MSYLFCRVQRTLMILHQGFLILIGENSIKSAGKSILIQRVDTTSISNNPTAAIFVLNVLTSFK